MKIPKPTAQPTEFKRKRSPPPQATKLLVASLSAGLVFMALLAIVFVPRYLENQNPTPSTLVFLDYNTSAGAPRLVVSSALYDLNLSLFNATLYRDNVTVASLPPGLGGTNNGLGFTDANHDGLLDAGDFFTIPTAPQGNYQLVVWQGNVGHIVGAKTWTGP